MVVSSDEAAVELKMASGRTKGGCFRGAGASRSFRLHHPRCPGVQVSRCSGIYAGWESLYSADTYSEAEPSVGNLPTNRILISLVLRKK